ncbi:MAG: hypothetical protein U0270_30255 [Labilithrix sp.]
MTTPRRPLTPSVAPALTLALALLLAACSKETTPAGPVGTPTDLRSHVEPGARAHAPPDDKAKRAELPVDVHGVKAKLAWRTFEEGPHKYIVSMQWEVETPAPGITLESMGLIGTPVNAGTTEAANEQIIAGVRWHDHNQSGTSLGDLTVTIRADGTGKKNQAN